MRAMFDRSALPAGPRVISVCLPAAKSFSMVVYVRAGSRLESRAESGVAHFMEHLTFKGTRAYPTTRLVSEAIEGVGGSSNAATDRESTAYWVRVPARDARRAVDLLGELIARPLLRDADIEAERDVIVEEIRSYRDDPGEFIFTLLDETLFGDTPMGWEIAGSETTVRDLSPDQIRSFWSRYYRPSNLTVAVAGDLEHETIRDLVATSFGSGDGVDPRFVGIPALPAGPRFRLAHRPGTQAHLAIGAPALPRDDPDTWIAEILNTVLGDGMSSRLFLNVREEAGLAYDVHSSLSEYADCGSLVVYAGVDPDRMDEALAAALRELARLRDERVPDAELAKAKAYARGRLELRLEEGRNLASWLGVQEALHARTLTPEEASEALERVTADDVQRLAGRLFRDDLLTLAVVAPPRRGRRLEQQLRLP